jgi:hypothetical protein
MFTANVGTVCTLVDVIADKAGTRPTESTLAVERAAVIVALGIRVARIVKTFIDIYASVAIP